VDVVICAHSEYGTPSTKRAAKKYVERLEIGGEAEARVARLPLRSLESVFERLRSFT
jgi:hypothetical protein